MDDVYEYLTLTIVSTLAIGSTFTVGLGAAVAVDGVAAAR